MFIIKNRKNIRITHFDAIFILIARVTDFIAIRLSNIQKY